MVCFPNCKINIGLFVTNKRSDGYHDLETVFYPVGTNSIETNRVLNDVLEIVPAKENTAKLHLTGLGVNGDSANNLVWKAYELFQNRNPEKITPLDIYLHKVIPMGAGLGGGSADGAFMLRLINDFYDLGTSDEELVQMALQLGSDCPFFIYNTPQYARGRGELMEPLKLDLSQYRIEVVCPGIHVSTKDAFSEIAPQPAPYDLRNLTALPITEWKALISNDFEKTVFKSHPELAALKKGMYDKGAVYASMTGTGSAVYGIFEKEF
ncbi:MAG: 4-(cytidine 5'-diphospho)-2-C-methyl-D-erythritol kinase [Taibaiella sp.]|nr:4-(cytidine 5'-diphospho)-2-C-methyl-D-erythritol kinase [Taibaiella sp.]